MKVLGIDTATMVAGIAIIDDDRVLAASHRDASARSTDVLVAIDGVCRAANVAPTELDAIAIGAGPGSFTGLRIGMATAKGIAFAANRPLWAVSSLAALADDAASELANEPADRVIVAVLDARRGEVFAGCFRGGTPLGDERAMDPSALAAWVYRLAAGAPTSFAGDALAVHRDALAPLAESWVAIATPSGRAIARLALAGPRVDVRLGGAPTYIRAPEAEIMYPDGVPGAMRRR